MTIDKPSEKVYNKKTDKRELSSAGRASALQAEGHRFEPCSSHHIFCKNRPRLAGGDFYKTEKISSVIPLFP